MKIENEVTSLLGSIKGWQYVLNSLPDLITILDVKQHVMWVNKAMADHLKVSPDTALGLKCFEVVHLSEEPIGNCPHMKMIQDGKEHTEEVYEENLGGYFLVTASPIKDASGNLLGSVHIARDITERKQMEDQIKNSLLEKELLIREIHHRVKNNLMIISSLLSIQASYFKDKKIQGIFKESQNRARSMAIIHEKLYQTTDHKKIDFGDYIRNLALELLRTYGEESRRVKMDFDLENHMLDINTSIPLGLVLNELVSNSLKHAFPQDKEGHLEIKFYREDDGYILTVQDDGIGLPDDFKIENSDTLGLKLVNGLVEQINGDLLVDTNQGTKFTIRFKEPEFR